MMMMMIFTQLQCNLILKTYFDDVSGYRMKFGAENKTATVEIIVNNVNMIRHSRSTTIAANFQSFVTSLFSSSLRNCTRMIFIAKIKLNLHKEAERQEERRRRKS